MPQFAKAFATALDPRKRTTGTSYTAKGSAQPPPQVDSEIGSAQGSQIRELVPALISQSQRLQTFNTMVNDDAAVDVSIRGGKVPVLGADFYIDPFDSQQENLDIQEFVDFNLFNGMSSPFLQTREDILRFYEDGFSVLEEVFELREWAPKRSKANRRKYTMLKKLGPRPAITISKINYDDNGGPLSIEQQAIRADGKTEKVTIDINKLVIFTLNKRGGDLTGRSLLRTAYKHWYYKNHFYKIDAIQKERHGIGIPKGKLAPNATNADKVAMTTLVKNLRTNEESGMVLPPGYDVEFAALQGQPVKVLESIEHHNNMIMLNVMVQFLMLGIESGGGSRATSGSHFDMFMKSLRYVGELICQYYNLYVIPKLVAYNFDTDKFPQMKVRNIGEGRDLQMWATAFAALVDKGVITMDLPTEQFARKTMDAPAKQGDRPSTLSNEQNAIDPNTGLPIATETTLPVDPKTGDVAGPSGPGNTGNDSTMRSGGMGRKGVAPTQP